MTGTFPAGVAIVAVHWYPDHVVKARRMVESLARATGAGLLVSVSNSPAIPPAELAPQGIEGLKAVGVQHNNSGMEFGAWQAGLDHVFAEGGARWVLFINDTLGIHQSFPTVHRRNLLAAIKAFSGANAAVAAGEVESIDRSYALAGARSHRWLTTNIFALNHAALQVLDHRVYRSELDGLIKASSASDEFFAAALDPVLVEHLSSWLFGERSRLAWYASAQLAPHNAARMAGKARAILQEKYLSAALEGAGARFVDISMVGLKDRVRRRVESALFRTPRTASTAI